MKKEKWWERVIRKYNDKYLTPKPGPVVLREIRYVEELYDRHMFDSALEAKAKFEEKKR